MKTQDYIIGGGIILGVILLTKGKIGATVGESVGNTVGGVVGGVVHGTGVSIIKEFGSYSDDKSESVWQEYKGAIGNPIKGFIFGYNRIKELGNPNSFWS